MKKFTLFLTLLIATTSYAQKTEEVSNKEQRTKVLGGLTIDLGSTHASLNSAGGYSGLADPEIVLTLLLVALEIL